MTGYKIIVCEQKGYVKKVSLEFLQMDFDLYRKVRKVQIQYYSPKKGAMRGRTSIFPFNKKGA